MLPSCRNGGFSVRHVFDLRSSEFAPPTTVPARSAGTDYHLFLRLDNSQMPGSSQLFNNHIPLDPRLGGAISVSKTTSAVNVTRGQMIPYVITVVVDDDGTGGGALNECEETNNASVPSDICEPIG